MKLPAEKNFDILISTLLGGSGVGLILVPGHLGVTREILPLWALALLGLSCFAVSLTLQVVSIWEPSAQTNRLMRFLSLVSLMAVSALYLRSGQMISAAAMAIGGIVQAAAILRSFNQPADRFDFTRLTISLISFMTGALLAVSGSRMADNSLSANILLLAAGFFITAFLGGATLIFPSFRFSDLMNQSQLVPWMALCLFYILPQNRDNLLMPAAVMSLLAFGNLFPWARLTLQEGDILSRRVIAIGAFVELAHLIFLGALLFAIDPGFVVDYGTILSAREGTLAFFLIFSVVVYYAAVIVVMTSNSLIHELSHTENENDEAPGLGEGEPAAWNARMQRYIKPFIMTPEGIRGRIQADQIQVLARQSANEKKRNTQLTLLLELSQQLENQLDPPVSAQLAVNTLERALQCGLVVIYLHEPDKKEFMLLATAGRQTHFVPAGYRQHSGAGAIGRALRQRKTQVINDIRLDPDYIYFQGEKNCSAAIIPMIYNGHVHGMIVLSDEKTTAFGSLEVGLAESVAGELMRAWERSGYQQRLTELIQTGSQLSSALDPETAAQEIAVISRQVLNAKFAYIYIQLGQEGSFTQQVSSGAAPHLLESLSAARISGGLIEVAMRSSRPFRIRDVRRYDKTSRLTLDNPSLRSLLAIPIRWHQVNIGAIFAFGKQSEVFFTENDQSLAELISIQAGGVFESAWLQQELRASLRITSLLYRLSNQIIQAENIEDAALDIAQTAHKLGKNLATGIVLLSPENEVIAEMRLDHQGLRSRLEHPMNLIRDAMQSGQMIYVSHEPSILRACLPIQTPLRSYGAIWMEAYDDPARRTVNTSDLQALVNQAAIALERSLLLVESRRQAKEIKAAYDTLATTYDQTLASLTSALDARDRETEGHSSRVTRLAVRLGESLEYSPDQLKILERGALLHDIGKIGISDTILHKPGPLTEDEWKLMKLHPGIGSKIVSGIPFLEDTITVIRFHQERWDGSGYPMGLKGSEIPELARLFAVVDAFDALTSKRPYREKISKEEALVYLKEEAGKLFDPDMVAHFEKICLNNPA
jgi:HD-GYP domain-containing protein (c-di-GMP phosphodiesterase class II)/putative methionine-R-sulfoxide reductase with GAF domain